MNTGAVVLSIFMMWSCGEGATQQQSQSKVYQSAVVQAEDITVERKFSAAIRGRQDIEIFAQVAGTITKVCVTEGQCQNTLAYVQGVVNLYISLGGGVRE